MNDAPSLRSLSTKLALAADHQEAAAQQIPAGQEAAFPIGALAGAVPWSLIWSFVESAVNAYLAQHAGQMPK